MQDGAAAMRPHMAELKSVNVAVEKVLKQLNDQVLDKVSALNTNIGLNAFSLPPPNPNEAKAAFDEYTKGMFKLLQAWQAQAEKTHAKTRGKTQEVLQQFSSQFASQVNQAMEIERKNWKEEARARERDAAERLKQSRAAGAAESRGASREAGSTRAHADEELAKRDARIKHLDAQVVALEVARHDDEETISLLRAKNRELLAGGAALETAQGDSSAAMKKMTEQEALLEDLQAHIKELERDRQNLTGGPPDAELKALRKRVAQVEREAQAQSQGRGDMQDRLQVALDELSGGGGGGGSPVAEAELRRQVAGLDRQLQEQVEAAACAASFVPIPSPPPERRHMGQMNAAELREELTVFTERLVDAKAGAVDVGVEGVGEELRSLARQMRHLMPSEDDESSISPRSQLLGVRSASPTTDELEVKIKQVQRQLTVSETKVKSLTKQLAFVAEGRRLAELDVKSLKEELSALKKENKLALTELAQLSQAATSEKRGAAREDAKAAKVEKGESLELRRLVDKWKKAASIGEAKLEAAKDFATRYQEEKRAADAANKQLTKQLKDTLAQHQKELAAMNWAANVDQSAAASESQERAKSREGRQHAAAADSQMLEQALRDEHERGQVAVQDMEAENDSLRDMVAQLQARAAAAEGGLANIGSQLAKKDAAIDQKDGQIQRLVTALSVLEQKVRGGAAGGGGGGGGGGGDVDGGASSLGSIITVDNYGAPGKRCGMCGGHAHFDRSLEAAASSAFVPSSTPHGMTRFGTTAKWAPQPEQTKPGHYEDGTQAATTGTAIADVTSDTLALANGGPMNQTGTMGTGPSGREEVPVEPPPEPEPEPEWLRGEDGWYFGDVDGEGETMCWMASRRLSSPERQQARSVSAMDTARPRLQLQNRSQLPPRAQSVGLPPLDDKRLGAPRGESPGSGGVSFAAGTKNAADNSVSHTQLQLDVPLAAGGRAAKAGSVAASAAQQQAARLPRLAGHLHVPPVALAAAQAQAQKGRVF